MNQKTIPPFGIWEPMEQFYEQKLKQANEIYLAFNWALSQQFMHTDDTLTLILLIFIVSFSFVPWQIKNEKNQPTQQIIWPFSRLFMYAKGNQKLNSRSTVLPKKGVQNKFLLEYMSLIRDLKGWISHTLQTPPLETQILCSTLSICPFHVDTFTWITYSWKLSFQIASL